MTRVTRYTAVMGAVLTLVCAHPAMAAQATVDEKTQLTFSEPVMVPGTTLSPGTYTFQIVNNNATQQMVQILDDQGKVRATTITVPLKRNATDVTGDTVLRFNPTDKSGSAAPVALKAWFYPGMMYGHEFVYSDQEARQIAQRTKSIVLSGDAPGADGQVGRLFTYDASGRRAPWSATAEVKTAPSGMPDQATAPMIQSDPQGMRVSVNQLEEHARDYIGKTVSVDAEVDEVLGPRIFKIDERRWIDLDPEMLVYVPSNLAALVQEGDRVTVTGTVRPFARAEIERDFDWLDPMPDFDVSLSMKPVLVATRVVGGNNNVAMTISVAPAEKGAAVGTSGTTTTGPAVTDVQALASGDDDLVGRHVDLNQAQVAGRAGKSGFWLRGTDGRSVYVLPAHPAGVRPAEGDKVSVSGVVLAMPRSMRDRFKKTANFNDDVYVFASNVMR